MPGRVGEEYFMTRGHLHRWREAAEIYIGQRGRGLMILEPEEGIECKTVDIVEHSIVYVPGHTAHRTVNTGNEPLVYLRICPAAAGQDFEATALRKFRKVVVTGPSGPRILDRKDFVTSMGW
jgi:glucose-6-phosphate isomerase